MNAYTVDQVASLWHCQPSTIERFIERGEIKARRDGRIGARELVTVVKRQYAITARYLELRRGGLSARQAWPQANREYWRKKAARR